jgi:hypothetical protein
MIEQAFEESIKSFKKLMFDCYDAEQNKILEETI